MNAPISKVCNIQNYYLYITSFPDHALQCLYDDVINDIQIVPVGISYQGAPLQKWPQNFLQYIKVFIGLWHSSPGYARVDFDQPFSLKEFKTKWENRLYFRKEEESQIHQRVRFFKFLFFFSN